MLDSVDRTIFINNVHDKITEDLLYELFLQAGHLENVKIIDKEGYRMAFVVFDDIPSVPYALELFDTTLMFGRPLNMSPKMGSCHKVAQRRRSMPAPGGNRQYHDYDGAYAMEVDTRQHHGSHHHGGGHHHHHRQHHDHRQHQRAQTENAGGRQARYQGNDNRKRPHADTEYGGGGNQSYQQKSSVHSRLNYPNSNNNPNPQKYAKRADQQLFTQGYNQRDEYNRMSYEPQYFDQNRLDHRAPKHPNQHAQFNRPVYQEPRSNQQSQYNRNTSNNQTYNQNNGPSANYRRNQSNHHTGKPYSRNNR